MKSMKFKCDNTQQLKEINENLNRIGYYVFWKARDVKAVYAYLDGDVTYDDSTDKYFQEHPHTETTLEELKAM